MTASTNARLRRTASRLLDRFGGPASLVREVRDPSSQPWKPTFITARYPCTWLSTGVEDAGVGGNGVDLVNTDTVGLLRFDDVPGNAGLVITTSDKVSVVGLQAGFELDISDYSIVATSLADPLEVYEVKLG